MTNPLVAAAKKNLKSLGKLSESDFPWFGIVQQSFEEVFGDSNPLAYIEEESDDVFYQRVHDVTAACAPLVHPGIDGIPDLLMGAFAWFMSSGAWMLHIDEIDYSDIDPQAVAYSVLRGLPMGKTSFVANRLSEDEMLDFAIHIVSTAIPEKYPDLIDIVVDHFNNADEEEDERILKSLIESLYENAPDGIDLKGLEFPDGSYVGPATGLPTLEEAFASSPAVLSVLSKEGNQFLRNGFVGNLWASEHPSDNQKAIIFSDSDIIFLSPQGKIWPGSLDMVIPRVNIDHISVGTADHVQYTGVTSSQYSLWSLTFYEVDGSSWTRFCSLGKSEAEVNKNRKSLEGSLHSIQRVYPIVAGDEHFSSSGGVRASYGVWF